MCVECRSVVCVECSTPIQGINYCIECLEKARPVQMETGPDGVRRVMLALAAALLAWTAWAWLGWSWALARAWVLGAGD